MGQRARALLSGRTALLLLFLAFLPALLAGCGGGSATTSTGSSASASNQGPSNGEGAQAPQGAHEGGEASIEEFGQEAAGAERDAILAALDGYLEALAQKDYASACGHMAAELHQTLERLVPKGPGHGCMQLLPRVLSAEAPEVAKGQLQGTVTKIRVEGPRGFVVFKAPGAKLYDMPMVEEGGRWKVAAAAAGVLVPEL